MTQATTLRKLFALSGIVPLGAFVAVHLVTTASALGGQARFERVFAARGWVTATVLVLVVLPLAFHAFYGAYLAATKPEEAALPSWLPRLRRTASFATLAFVVGHVIEVPARMWAGSFDAGALFTLMTAHLSSTWHSIPVVAVAYLVGVAATLAHFGLGLWAYLPASGVAMADGARRALGWTLVVGGTLLFLVAANTVVFFATGSRIVGPSAPAFVPEGPPVPACPKP
jgi:succinate dehydrogenase / fumarate reductase cytochrome b subunit